MFVSGSGTIALLPKKCLDLTIAIWMKDMFNSGPATVGGAMGFAGVAAFLGNICAAKLSIFLPQFTYILHAVNLALAAVPLILLPFSPNPFIVAVCYFFGMFFANLNRYWVAHIPSDIADKKYSNSRGRVMNVVSVFMSLPAILGPFLAIILFNAVGFRYVCVVSGCLCIGYAILFVFVPYSDNHVQYSLIQNS